MRFTACAAVVLAIAAQQAPQPVIRSRVTMVPLDVRVLDVNGRPVTDLSAADFTVSEDGVAQSIAYFAAHGLVPEPAAAEAPLEFAGMVPDTGSVPRPQNRRVVLVHLTSGHHQAFKHSEALAGFITSLMPQDLVAISAWNRTTDLSPDHRRLGEIAERYAGRHERIEMLIREWFEGLRGQYMRPRILPPHIQAEIDWVFEPASLMRKAAVPQGRVGLAEHMRRSLPPGSYSDTPRLIAGLNYLRQLAGEKRVIFVTEFGSGVLDPRRRGGSIAARAAHDRIALDVIQTGGTIGAPPARFVGPMENRRISMPIVPSSGSVASFMWQLRDIRETAAESGGIGSTLKRGRDAYAALAAATAFHYVLGYYPAETTTGGEYRSIHVTVARPGVRVLARQGYFARPPAEGLDVRQHSAAARIHQAMTSRRALPGIGVMVTDLTSPSAQELDVQVRIELGHVMPLENDGHRAISLEVAVVASGDGRRLVGETKRRVDLTMTPEEWDRSVREGLTVTLRLPVASRARQLRAIVYDVNGDNVGSAIVEVRGR